MRESPHESRRRVVAILVLSFAAAGLVALADEGILIDNVTVEGSALHVDLANPGDHPVTATVYARVLTEDGEVELRARATVAAGGRSAVVLDAGSPILDLTVLGAVLDDGSPF